MSTIAQAMIGRPISQFYQKESHVRQGTALEVRHIDTAQNVSDISLTIRRGEVLGLAGVIGSGRTEIARAIFGADPVTAGSVRVRDVEVRVNSPVSAIRQGIGFVPENRKTEGLFFNLSPLFNTTIARLSRIAAAGWLKRRRENIMGLELFGQFQVAAHASRTVVRQLSGGNQQKLLLARWVFAGVEILILDEPTQGIDIGARQEVYRIINELTRSGVAILLISSDMPELLAISDRIAVIKRGRILMIGQSRDFTQVQLAEMMAGSNGVGVS